MEIQLNRIPQGATLSTTYEYKPTKDVKSITPSCGCMDAKYDRPNQRILLTFRASKLNAQALMTKGYETIYKYITVNFTDGTSQKINVTGQITT